MNSNNKVTRGDGILEKFLAQKRASKVNSLIPSEHNNGRILDIGCGSYPWFLQTVKVKERYGLDKSLTREIIESIDLPGTKLKNWDYIKEERLSFDDNYFETVTMLAVFEHIELSHLDRLISEINRVLKPGGRFIMTTPAGWTDPLLRLLARLNIVSAEEIDDHKDTYTQKKVINILSANGFPAGKIQTGTFEMFMNIWACAVKS